MAAPADPDLLIVLTYALWNRIGGYSRVDWRPRCASRAMPYTVIGVLPHDILIVRHEGAARAPAHRRCPPHLSLALDSAELSRANGGNYSALLRARPGASPEREVPASGDAAAAGRFHARDFNGRGLTAVSRSALKADVVARAPGPRSSSSGPPARALAAHVDGQSRLGAARPRGRARARVRGVARARRELTRAVMRATLFEGGLLGLAGGVAGRGGGHLGRRAALVALAPLDLPAPRRRSPVDWSPIVVGGRRSACSPGSSPATMPAVGGTRSALSAAARPASAVRGGGGLRAPGCAG